MAYDNYDFKDRKRDPRLGHETEMTSMTVAALTLCPSIPSTGLRQSMHHPLVPFNVKWIYDAPGIAGDEHLFKISIFHIHQAIKCLHSKAVKQIYAITNHKKSHPQLRMPVFDVLPPHRTETFQFGACYENEGTISGSYKVHENLFQEQLEFKPPDDITAEGAKEPKEYVERLFLIHGDQLTSHMLRILKSEQARAGRPYDRRQWYIGVPAWFHIMMNYLWTIVRTHWAPDEPTDHAHHCIRADMTRWGRTGVSRENPKYHVLQLLIAQSYTARVNALFYKAVQKRGYFKDHSVDNLDRMSAFDEVIQGFSPDEYQELLEDVLQAAFTKDAWDGVGHKDKEFIIQCRFLQEIELFLTIHHAVKFADIGLLRRTVEPLIVMFTGAGQTNYGYEMMYLRWLLSDACDPVLQRSILASSLVNWSGKPGNWKPFDLSIEHLNCKLKHEINTLRNSTHDTDATFDTTCLTNAYTTALKEAVESNFGEIISGNHTTKKAQDDMFITARQFFADGLVALKSNTEVERMAAVYESRDIMKDGMAQMWSKSKFYDDAYIEKKGFNQGSYARQTIQEDGTVLPARAEEGASLAQGEISKEDAQDFASFFDESTDRITQPTADIGVDRTNVSNERD